MNQLKLTLRNGKVVFGNVPNVERFKDYIESVNDRRSRFIVFDDYAVNLDLVEEIEIHGVPAEVKEIILEAMANDLNEIEVLDINESELGDGTW